MINEKIKKVLKIAGIIFLALFLYGLLQIFSGGMTKSRVNNLSVGTSMEQVGMPMRDEMYDDKSMDSLAGNAPMDSRGIESGEVDSSVGLNMPSTDKKIIKNGNLSLKVKKTEEAAREIGNIAKAKGGEIFSTNFYERVRGSKSGNITVKVPVSSFEEAVDEIKGVATQVVSESTTGQDVSEQYSDLQAQLKNKKAEEQSFIAILDRAGDIEDVLAVTKQISRVRGEIERLEGRIRFMDSQTEMSTIVATLSEDVEVAPIGNDWRPWQVVKSAVKELVKNIQGFADGLIRFVIVGIPSFIPFLIVLWFAYWIVRKIYEKIRKA